MTKHNATWTEDDVQRDGEWVKIDGEHVLVEDDDEELDDGRDTDHYWDYTDDYWKISPLLLRARAVIVYMCDNDSLSEIAEQIGKVTEEQNDGEDEPAREGEEFDPEDMKRNKNDYHGGW